MATPNDLSLKEIDLFLRAHNGRVSKAQLLQHFRKLLKTGRHEDTQEFKKNVHLLASRKYQGGQEYILLRDTMNKENSTKQTSETNPNRTSNTIENKVDPVRSARPLPLKQLFDILMKSAEAQDSQAIKKIASHKFDEQREEVDLPTVSNKNQEAGEGKQEALLATRMERENGVASAAVPALDLHCHSLNNENSKAHKLTLEATPCPELPNPAELSFANISTSSQDSFSSVKTTPSMKADLSADFLAAFCSTSSVSCTNLLDLNEDSTWQTPKPRRLSLFSLTPLRSSASKTASKQKSEFVKNWIGLMQQGHFEEVRSFAEQHQQLLSSPQKGTGFTCLHYAAKFGHVEAIKLLLGTYELDVDVQTKEGRTALHLAAMHNHYNAYELLKSVYRADECIKDQQGHTPWYYGAPNFKYVQRTPLFLERVVKAVRKSLRIVNATPTAKRTPTQLSLTVCSEREQ